MDRMYVVVPEASRMKAQPMTVPPQPEIRRGRGRRPTPKSAFSDATRKSMEAQVYKTLINHDTAKSAALPLARVQLICSMTHDDDVGVRVAPLKRRLSGTSQRSGDLSKAWMALESRGLQLASSRDPAQSSWVLVSLRRPRTWVGLVRLVIP